MKRKLYAIKNGKTGRLLRIDSESETYTEDYYMGEGEPPTYARDHLELSDSPYAGPVFVTFVKSEVDDLIKNGTYMDGEIRINKGWGNNGVADCELVEILLPAGITLPEEVD